MGSLYGSKSNTLQSRSWAWMHVTCMACIAGQDSMVVDSEGGKVQHNTSVEGEILR